MFEIEGSQDREIPLYIWFVENLFVRLVILYTYTALCAMYGKFIYVNLAKICINKVRVILVLNLFIPLKGFRRCQLECQSSN